MSGKKTYTLFLNSQNSTNVDASGGIGAYKFYVNWGSFLPREYERFDFSYQFRSLTSTTDPVNSVLASVDFGSRTMYNQSYSQTNVIGAIIPRSYVTGTTPRYYYESNNTDDCGFMVYYPQSSFMTVSITNFDGTSITNFPTGYILQLCFTVID